eukprot:6112263-Pyramimonas_sp.AAC.1
MRARPAREGAVGGPRAPSSTRGRRRQIPRANSRPAPSSPPAPPWPCRRAARWRRGSAEPKKGPTAPHDAAEHVAAVGRRNFASCS